VELRYSKTTEEGVNVYVVLDSDGRVMYQGTLELVLSQVFTYLDHRIDRL